MGNGSPSFVINKERLAQMMLAVAPVASGLIERYRAFLPEWNLPTELEYPRDPNASPDAPDAPPQRSVAKPYEAALLLFWRTQWDKLMRSDILTRDVFDAWRDPNWRWMFYPLEIVRREPAELTDIIRDKFHVGLNRDSEYNQGQRMHMNAERLLLHYRGDPRLVVDGKEAEDARKSLQLFEGWGAGLASLYLMELTHRNIIQVKDPEHLAPKVDRHKARIPLNLGAVQATNGSIHASSLAEALAEAYVTLAKEHSLSMPEIDSALWLIGGRLCTQKDMGVCWQQCPLYDMCKSRVGYDMQGGNFLVHDEEGRRIDVRKNNGQRYFEFKG